MNGWVMVMVETNNSAPMMEVRGLGKDVDRLQILNSMTFEIGEGEVVGLIGPNGAGKTTLMRTLAGLYSTTRGTASVLGHPIGSPGARRALSLMPEDPDLYPGLSVVEHVRLIERLNGTRSSAEVALDLLERYGLRDKHDALPHELSQGMRRKLALVLALRKGSRVLLLDEPFNGLDPVSARELREEIRHLSEDGHGILISMHGLGDLARIADRVLILYGGKIAHVADLSDDSASRDSLEDSYLTIVGAIRNESA
ncbi:ABC transporter ATP-binding protein [Rathayibacter sp. AY1B1]|nr:ABC transporter ATP-binding protein [Rathayibacter sp. AY1B6]PPI39139.1 ABC transporter ATP-binding protein [Rathayibacter sp. AY1B1]